MRCGLVQHRLARLKIKPAESPRYAATERVCRVEVRFFLPVAHYALPFRALVSPIECLLLTDCREIAQVTQGTPGFDTLAIGGSVVGCAMAPSWLSGLPA